MEEGKEGGREGGYVDGRRADACSRPSTSASLLRCLLSSKAAF